MKFVQNIFFVTVVLHGLSLYGEQFRENMVTTKYYDRCMEEAMGTADVVACMEAEIGRQDRRLNENYRKAMKMLSKERRKVLRSVQRRWIRYRDAKCGFLYFSQSGSGGLEDMQQCLLIETIRRADELENLR